MLKAHSDILAVPSRIIREEGKQIRVLRKAVLASGDPETIHDLRIAIRRVRTAIRLFWPVFSQEARLLDGPLRELFQTLGAVRNLDLAIASACSFSPDVRIEILERLAEVRQAERLKVLAALARPCVLDNLSAMSTPVSLSPRAGTYEGRSHPIQIAHRQANLSFRKVAKVWDLSEVHRLRRRIKRLRYAVEFFRPGYGSEAKAYAKGLVELQDRIGATMDLVGLSVLFSHLDKLSRPSTKECQLRSAEMAEEVGKQRQSILASRKTLSGSAWKKLKGLTELGR